MAKLRQEEKEKINQALYEAFREVFSKDFKNGRKPNYKKKDPKVIAKAQQCLNAEDAFYSKHFLTEQYIRKKKHLRRELKNEMGIQEAEAEVVFLGSGHALPQTSYNTCFVLENAEKQCFLVDTGGGNQILTQLKRCRIHLDRIEDIFISHKHLDHIMGLFWILRVIGYDLASGKRTKPLRIYACPSVIETIEKSMALLSGEKVNNLLGKEIRLIPVRDGEEVEIIGFKTVFFSIQSSKIEQYGFKMIISGKNFVFLGDEPYRKSEEAYASKAYWLVHEAFCLEKDKKKFQPAEKMHSTVKEAAQNAEELGAKELFIVHSEDYQDKASLFKKEASKYFHGKIHVVQDRSVFYLK